MITPTLPWHRSQWDRVQAMQVASRLPHALLLRGPRGVGKASFATRLAAALLCTAGGAAVHPCGECRGCRLVESANHPDCFRVVPPEPGKTIGIDQVRALIGQLALTPRLAAHKLGIIEPADRMTVSAANSLLKTLEEPPGPTVLVLLSSKSVMLPATILSRCQVLEFPPAFTESAHAWLGERLDEGVDPRYMLRLAGGAPLGALGLAEDRGIASRDAVLGIISGLSTRETDPVEAAEQWRTLGFEASIYWLSALLGDLARFKMTREAETLLNVDLAAAMQAIGERLDLNVIFDLLAVCAEVQRLRATHPGLNEQPLLESVALAFEAGESRVA